MAACKAEFRGRELAGGRRYHVIEPPKALVVESSSSERVLERRSNQMVGIGEMSCAMADESDDMDPVGILRRTSVISAYSRPVTRPRST